MYTPTRAREGALWGLQRRVLGLGKPGKEGERESLGGTLLLGCWRSKQRVFEWRRLVVGEVFAAKWTLTGDDKMLNTRPAGVRWL